MGKRLILWDIDKTLLDVDGVGMDAFSAAFAQVTGLSDHIATRGAGRTEWQAFNETLEVNGLHDPGDWFPAFSELMTARLIDRAPEMLRRGRVLPGARPALRRCAATPGVVQALLTGNPQATARAKLRTFGLDDVLEDSAVAMGGYGDDDPLRSALVPIAQRRVYERTGIEFTADTTVLVGDTPNDVLAAREGGARVVAVATGLSDAAALAAAGAPTVLADLSDTDAVMEAVLG